MWVILGLINIVLAFFAENYYNKNKQITFVCLGLIVLVNTFFIGLRDFGVGVDTVVYIEEYFLFARKIVYLDYFLSDETHDKGFVILAIIANFFSESKQGLLIVTEFFITLFIVLGIYEFKKTINFSFAGFFMLFWLLYQQETINLMRQFCAMSLLFYGFAKLLQKKYIFYCFIQIIAYFFHSTSLLFLIVPIGLIISKSKSKLIYFISILLLIVGAFYVYNHFYDLLNFVGAKNLISEIYTDRYGELSTYERSGGRLTFKLFIPAIMLIMVYYYKFVSKMTFYIMMFLLLSTFLLEQTKFISQFFFRMSYYPGLVFIVYFSELFKRRYWQKMYYIQLICILIFLRTAYGNYTFMDSPKVGFEYRSKILGIR